MSRLAIHGGNPIRRKPFGKTPVVSINDYISLFAPFRNNCFSGFSAGCFHGGPMVQRLEEQMLKIITGAKYAVAFDTWSNGIFASLIALGIKAGDEVILPAYTMTACASSVLSCGAIPVFADIDEKTLNIDPNDVEKKITSRTKVIMAVHLFGMPCDMDKLLEICKTYKIILFEDVAQAPCAIYKDRFCGTIGDLGGLSLTQSKHVMCGEGGVAITSDIAIANGLRYVRNHGEVNSLPGCKNSYFDNMHTRNIVGFNFRMTEISASFAYSQLKRLNNELKLRREMVEWIEKKTQGFPYLLHLSPHYECKHSYYCYTLIWNHPTIPREKFVGALLAEGIPCKNGYCQPIYKQHIYRERSHWAIKIFGESVSYTPLPITEWADKNLIVFTNIRSPNNMNDMKDIVKGIEKVLYNIEELR